jgi:hypothetical protein
MFFKLGLLARKGPLKGTVMLPGLIPPQILCDVNILPSALFTKKAKFNTMGLF